VTYTLVHKEQVLLTWFVSKGIWTNIRSKDFVSDQ